MCLEKAYSEAGACTIAERSRPGYEGCTAEEYINPEEGRAEADADAALRGIENMLDGRG